MDTDIEQEKDKRRAWLLLHEEENFTADDFVETFPGLGIDTYFGVAPISKVLGVIRGLRALDESLANFMLDEFLNVLWFRETISNPDHLPMVRIGDSGVKSLPFVSILFGDRVFGDFGFSSWRVMPTWEARETVDRLKKQNPESRVHICSNDSVRWRLSPWGDEFALVFNYNGAFIWRGPTGPVDDDWIKDLAQTMADNGNLWSSHT